MTTATQNETVPNLDTTRTPMSGLLAGFGNFHFKETPDSKPKLRPGAAITLAIAAVFIVLSFIEVIFS